MEGKQISNIEQRISNDEGQNEVKGYQGNRRTGYQVEGGFN